uniref:Progestin and adipoQ receptor family member VIII n=1 Tax=Maylandia zebra TaxID=106582 RepID=A0A3P9C5W0_9CICH
ESGREQKPLSTKHPRRLPHLSDFLPFSLLPPSPTVTASQVPSLFREPYILSGYRPVQQDWRCYLLSLFRKHNESLNVWTHLLAGPVLLLRWWANVDTLGCTLDDVTSLPLLLFLVSSLTYLYLSVAAHLLQSHSERALDPIQINLCNSTSTAETAACKSTIIPSVWIQVQTVLCIRTKILFLSNTPFVGIISPARANQLPVQ